MDFWQVLPAAIALVFIFEGLMPFISPNRWRNMLETVGQMDDRVIRNIGLGSMLFGLALLYWVNPNHPPSQLNKRLIIQH